ncbi:hypothetical protein MXMO3_00915 [Maritalea myrionectae]|uniref:Uncharacterized protein n=1 Tax=Maritalea myrionectae TaxID=454601 RepID=A0A2R4MC24_9HYPH|nr:hypothetical protein [Maritalea myrionectae]AVX03446.1 hypothetical protein MXMO3_00915 [Maritalea myrionectae]
MNSVLYPILIVIVLFGAVAVFELYALFVAPHFIPRETIDLIIADLIEQHGDNALDAAIAREDWAQQDTDTFERGKWRRVRRELEKRL